MVVFLGKITDWHNLITNECLGTHGINWISEDCGGNIRALNSGRKVQEFLYHPTERSWALAASWTSCEEFQDEPCKIYKELYITKNLGEEWNFVQNYVFDFEWGQSKYANQKGVIIPNERIFLTRDPDASGHQSSSKKATWSTKIDLYMSDDLFKTPAVMVLEAGNTIIKTPQYMFIAASHSDEKRVSIYSANYMSGFKTFKSVRLPTDAVLSNTFTVLDTTESQVFLFIENHGLSSPFGNLYISDEKGRSFTLSMENVIKGEAVDFEKVQSMDGTYVVNIFTKGHKHAAEKDRGEFDAADIIAAESKKSRMSRMGNSGNENSK